MTNATQSPLRLLSCEKLCKEQKLSYEKKDVDRMHVRKFKRLHVNFFKRLHDSLCLLEDVLISLRVSIQTEVIVHLSINKDVDERQVVMCFRGFKKCTHD